MAGSKPLAELEPFEPDHSRLESLNRGRRALASMVSIVFSAPQL